MRLLKLLLILCMCAAGPAAADPLEDALAASHKGDHATAIRLWRLLADQGNAVAQHNLGIMYSLGHGVPLDYTAAVSWYRKAADQGYAQCQYKFGVMSEVSAMACRRTTQRQCRGTARQPSRPTA